MKISVPLIAVATSALLLTACGGGGGGGGGGDTPDPVEINPGPAQTEIDRAEALTATFRSAILLNAIENTPLFSHTTNSVLCVDTNGVVIDSPLVAPFVVGDTIEATIAVVACDDSYSVFTDSRQLLTLTSDDVGAPQVTDGNTTTTTNDFIGSLDFFDGEVMASVGTTDIVLGGNTILDFQATEEITTNTGSVVANGLSSLQICSNLVAGSCASGVNVDTQLTLEVGSDTYIIDDYLYSLTRTEALTNPAAPSDTREYSVALEGSILNNGTGETIEYSTNTPLSGSFGDPASSNAPSNGEILLDNGDGAVVVTFTSGNYTVTNAITNEVLVASTPWDNL